MMAECLGPDSPRIATHIAYMAEALAHPESSNLCKLILAKAEKRFALHSAEDSDISLYADTLLSIGGTYHGLGDVSKAMDYYKKCWQLSAEITPTSSEVAAVQITRVLNDERKYDEELKFIDDAFKRRSFPHYGQQVGSLRIKLSSDKIRCLRQLKLQKQAITWLKAEISDCRKDLPDSAQCLIELSQNERLLYADLRNLEKQLSCTQESCSLLKKYSAGPNLSLQVWSNAAIDIIEKNPAEARNYIQMICSIPDEEISIDQERQFHEVLTALLKATKASKFDDLHKMILKKTVSIGKAATQNSCCFASYSNIIQALEDAGEYKDAKHLLDNPGRLKNQSAVWMKQHRETSANAMSRD